VAMLRISGTVNGPARSILTGVDELRAWLPEMVKAIGMKCVGDVVIQEYAHWETGIAPSAVQFIEESAVVVHCYPEGNFIQIVLDSCKPIYGWPEVANKIKAKLDLKVQRQDYDPLWGWKA